MSAEIFILHKDQTRAGVMVALLRFIGLLSSEIPWQITIERWVKERTDVQNSALWGVAYKALEKSTGQSANDWHEYMLGEHFGWVEYEMFGKRKLRPARTTTTDYEGRKVKLSTAEFANYYDFIQSRAAENGVHVPDPDPLHGIKRWAE